jgi:hypothetical protein
VINALDKAWHPEHFACATCKQPLNNSFFHGDDMIPYCEKHYYASQGLLCAACDKPILTGMLLSGGWELEKLSLSQMRVVIMLF